MMARNEKKIIFIVVKIRICFIYMIENHQGKMRKCSVPKLFRSHFQDFSIFLVIVLSSGCVSELAVLLVDTNLGYH